MTDETFISIGEDLEYALRSLKWPYAFCFALLSLLI
jgi:hypothetical protein